MTFRELRESKGFTTQQSLATAADCEQTTVSQIELGKIRNVRYLTVRKLADALGVTTEVVARAINDTVAA